MTRTGGDGALDWGTVLGYLEGLDSDAGFFRKEMDALAAKLADAPSRANTPTGRCRASPKSSPRSRKSKTEDILE
ncbi:hypothetical protein OIU34_19935 [Pararhizobium sp. BT-229]|uniref:hypothetical protein n=1 Tax=Pararhizobium sp. BT-229 TaxID=2986923 RepID=UPI0021F6D2FE|nr:hypothetical protein [Pararhizobium sp. BT-229]MCV9964157.1 hypothetical protein [Pararhizobium sp. BT-229]